MKRLLLVILLFSLASGYAQRKKLRIAYIDMEMILDSMPEYKQAMDELNLRVVQWKAKLDRMQSEIDRLKKELEAEKLMLTKELIKEKEEIIAFKEKQLTKFQMEKFGPQGDLELQRMMILKPVQDQVFNTVRKIAQTRHYDIVFDKSDPRAGVVFVEPRLNITHLVIRELKKQHKRSLRHKRRKKDAKPKKDKQKNVNLHDKYRERLERLRKQREQQARKNDSQNQEDNKDKEQAPAGQQEKTDQKPPAPQN